MRALPRRGLRLRRLLSVSCLAGALVIGTVGCGQERFDPSPMKWGGDQDLPERGKAISPPSETGNDEDDGGGQVDVCSFVSADEIQQIFGTETTPSEGEDLEGMPDIGAGVEVSRCTFTWGDTQEDDAVSIAVVPEMPATDPEEFVTSVMGDAEYEELVGLGDYAALDTTSGRYGNGYAAAVAAQQTDTGTAAVMVLAPVETEGQAFIDLGTRILSEI